MQWPTSNKNKDSRYLIKDAPPFPDLTKNATPKPVMGATFSPMKDQSNFDPDCGSFLPFVNERDKLSRIIKVADKTMRKNTPQSAISKMKALHGNKLLVKLRKTPKLSIARELGQQFTGNGPLKTDEYHLQDVISNMNKQSQYLIANDI